MKTAQLRLVFGVIVAICGPLMSVGAVLPKVFAESTPQITLAAAELSGNIHEEIPITGIEITGVSDEYLPVNLYVPYGSLSMTVTDGLFFEGDQSGSNLQFSGTLTDINNALATLKYSADKVGDVRLSISLTTSSEIINPINGHLYEVVETDPITATEARVAAAQRQKAGMTGYLVTITSQEENDFIADRIDRDSWIGASDSEEEGVWIWDTGPEAGTQFWQGGSKYNGGHAVGSEYANWEPVEPNNSSDMEHCGEYYASTKEWNDLSCDDATLMSYIVEYGDNDTISQISHKSLIISVNYPTGQERTITTCQQLIDIAEDPLEYRYDTILLANNLNCQGKKLPGMFNAVADEDWVSFRGIFDGQGHTVSNFIIDGEDAEHGHSSFFGTTQDATIRNLTLSNASIANHNECTGGLIASATDTTISNVTVDDVAVSGYGYAYTGGLVGCYENSKNKALTNNTVTDVSIEDGGWCSGGFIGQSYTYSRNGVLAINKNTLDTTTKARESAGGLIGCAYVHGGSTLKIQDNAVVASIECDSLCSTLVSHAEVMHSHYAVESNTVSGYAHELEGPNGGASGITNLLDAYHSSVRITDNDIDVVLELNDDSQGGGLIAKAYVQTPEEAIFSRNRVAIDLHRGTSYGTGGLIGHLSDSALLTTISYNTVSGTIDSNAESTGGLVGLLQLYGPDSTNPYRVHMHHNSSSADVSGIISVGGLVGDIAATQSVKVDIEESYATGNVVSVLGIAGGLVGRTAIAQYVGVSGSVNIADSYNTGSVEAPVDVGGIVGKIEVSPEEVEQEIDVNLTRTYNTGTVVSENSAGGIIGGVYDFSNEPAQNSNVSINMTHVFSTGALELGEEASYYGAIAGDLGNLNHITVNGTGVYFDEFRSGTPNCTFPVDILEDCNAVNADESDPDYFRLNTTNPPLNTWDFEDVWAFSSDLNDGYPCLRWQGETCASTSTPPQESDDNDGDGILNTVENGGPNDGDANNDGILDSEQQHVASWVSPFTNMYVVIELASGCGITSVNVTRESSNAVQDPGYRYDSGFVNFTATCSQIGYTTSVKIYQFGVPKDGVVVRKYNPHSRGYFTVNLATLTHETVGGKQAAVASYSITDGSSLDVDGAPNGVIVDPVGFGTPVTGAPNTGLRPL